jgi:hypothetical protein
LAFISWIFDSVSLSATLNQNDSFPIPLPHGRCLWEVLNEAGRHIECDPFGAFVHSDYDWMCRSGFLSPRDRVAHISRLAIVAVEPPPLLVTDVGVRSAGATILPSAGAVATVSPVAGLALVVIGTVAMLTEHAAADVPRLEPADAGWENALLLKPSTASHSC